MHALNAARRVCPRVAASAPDRIHTHTVNAEEQPILVARCVVKDGTVCRDRIIDRLAEKPLSLRADRKRQIVFRKRLFRHKWNIDGSRVADRFRQQADLIMEVRTRAETAVPPRGIVRARTRRDAGLSFRCKAAVHGCAYLIKQRDDQRVEEEIERIAEGRSKHYRAGWPGLMVVVNNLREPLAVQDLVDRFGFRQCRHVEVPVIIVARVFVVKPGNAIGRTAGRLSLAHVPIRDKFHAVRIDEAVENDNVIQQSRRFRIRAARQLIDALDQLLRPENLGRMDSAVDPHHRFALSGESPRLILR